MNDENTPRHKSDGSEAGVSDEVLIARIDVRHTVVRFVGSFFLLVGFGLVVLACWPVAEALSGEETVVNVTMAFGVTATVSIACTGIAAWGRQHKRRADRLDRRNRDLTRDVRTLKSRLKALGGDTTLP